MTASIERELGLAVCELAVILLVTVKAMSGFIECSCELGLGLDGQGKGQGLLSVPQLVFQSFHLHLTKRVPGQA